MERKGIVVRAVQPVRFPNAGYLRTRVTEPVNERILVEVQGRSGQSRWTEALFTLPADAFCEGALAEGIYEIREAQDKRGRRLLRFFRVGEDAGVEFLLFGIDGFIVPAACEGEIEVLAEAVGHSRSGRHGDRWSLVAARCDAVIAYAGYYHRGGPIYVRVTSHGLLSLGESEAVLPPSEW